MTLDDLFRLLDEHPTIHARLSVDPDQRGTYRIDFRGPRTGDGRYSQISVVLPADDDGMVADRWACRCEDALRKLVPVAAVHPDDPDRQSLIDGLRRAADGKGGRPVT